MKLSRAFIRSRRVIAAGGLGCLALGLATQIGGTQAQVAGAEQTVTPATEARTTANAPASNAKSGGGNVIFFHPDGTSLSHWDALRTYAKGPDGVLHWDRLPHMAVYAGHMKDALAGTSNGGATVHAYGVKVKAKSFGLDGSEPITAASGQRMSIMQEAMAAGRAVGVVQTGHIAEPGTAAFLASVPERDQYDEIARQVVKSGAQVIMSGGEAYLLPKGMIGRHGEGQREDGLDLISWAKAQGYEVVYDRAELAAADLGKVTKLLGVFAHEDTFHDQSEEKNKAAGLESYLASAPTIAEMGAAALKILSRHPGGFFLVAEEEGTDNLPNNNNAKGTLEALSRADEAVAVFHDHVKANPNTLLLMAADSNAGGLQLVGPYPGRGFAPGEPLPATGKNGAPLDGIDGTGTIAFMSAPDRNFHRWPFAIAWSGYADVSGGVLARAAGRNAERVNGRVDNTDIYRIMYEVLFNSDVAANQAGRGPHVR